MILKNKSGRPFASVEAHESGLHAFQITPSVQHGRISFGFCEGCTSVGFSMTEAEAAGFAEDIKSLLRELNDYRMAADTNWGE